jgi:F0F1-type ATP synthase membrane subunit b/b'
VRSDIINEVLTVEDRAQEVVRNAEREAREIVTNAQAEANAFVRDALKQERINEQEAIAQAEADNAAELAEFEASLDRSSHLSAKEVKEIAEAIVKEVCKTTLDGIGRA